MLGFPEARVTYPLLAAFLDCGVVDARIGMLQFVNEVRYSMLRGGVVRAAIKKQEQKLECRSHQILSLSRQYNKMLARIYVEFLDDVKTCLLRNSSVAIKTESQA